MLTHTLHLTRYNAAFLVLIASSSYGAELRELTPDQKFAVSTKLPQIASDMKVREMQFGGGGLWFLLEPSTSASSQMIVKSDDAGNARVVATLPADTRAIGLAGSSRGVATVLVSRGQRSLVEFSATGDRLFSVGLGCFHAQGLIAIMGSPATICPDGTITRYSGKDEQRYSSWAKAGAVIREMSNGNLAIVDQSSAGILFNNLKSGAVSLVQPPVPEISEAKRRVQAVEAAAKASLRPAGAPLGNQLIVMDAASDATGLYLLIWPYKIDSGPVVIRLDNAGSPVSRFRCLTQGEPNVHKVAVRDGQLFLSSVAGVVFRFKL